MQIFYNFLSKIKNKGDSAIGVGVNPAVWPEAVTTSLIIILVAFGSFGLGRLSRIEESKTPLKIKEISGVEAQVGSISPVRKINIGTNVKGVEEQISEANKVVVPNEGFIVASKTGKKYHFPWCAGAQQIKEENKIWFANEAEAKAAGYSPAANCKGLPQ